MKIFVKKFYGVTNDGDYLSSSSATAANLLNCMYLRSMYHVNTREPCVYKAWLKLLRKQKVRRNHSLQDVFCWSFFFHSIVNMSRRKHLHARGRLFNECKLYIHSLWNVVIMTDVMENKRVLFIKNKNRNTHTACCV